MPENLRSLRQLRVGHTAGGVSAGRLALALVGALLGLVVVAALSIAFALRVTPAQSVSALGQTVEVGTTSPSLSLSGPGVLDLFGESLPTQARFTGPVRPRLVLTKITVTQQVANFLSPSGRRSEGSVLGRRLANGWVHYFAWEVGFTALGAVVLALAFVGLRRPSWRRSVLTVVLALVVAEGVNLGWVMLTAYSAPKVLRQVHSLSALVGRTQQPPIPPASGPPTPGVSAVVLGDSTAAGLGNPLVAHPSALDSACHRSSDAYAVDLAEVNDWNVENLACSGATIPLGILGSQGLGPGLTAPAQLAEAKRATGLKAVFVSVGADDVRWDALVELCAISSNCDSTALTAYFQSNLHQFTTNYYDLLAQLSALPGHPRVVVNEYYNPFGPDLGCLAHAGLSAAKVKVLVQHLDALNTVLSKGAKASGFRSATPDFSGHQLCSAQPYVQGLDDPAPFHPTASGELAIGFADEGALGS